MTYIEITMDELQQRRLDRLNKEYKASPNYIEPVFSSRRIAVMVAFALGLIVFVMVIYGLS